MGNKILQLPGAETTEVAATTTGRSNLNNSSNSKHPQHNKRNSKEVKTKNTNPEEVISWSVLNTHLGLGSGSGILLSQNTLLKIFQLGRILDQNLPPSIRISPQY